tara:strand:- start:14501 stop:16234 length:1734 start_codon:yes stop_codon:yes gene_type:complete
MILKKINLYIFLAFLSLFSNYKIYCQYNYQKSNPIDLPLNLSGNFGEIRGTHFHAGIDIKTNGKEGYEIKSIDDGTLTRVSISLGSYGKAIYIKHYDGTTSVYAHLKKFSKKIEDIIKRFQYNNKTFVLNKFFKENHIIIKKNELIGYSGNTGGSSGPHLHFEIRDSKTQNVLNPHLFGYKLNDSKEPVIKRIFLYSLNKFERFENDKIKKNIPFKVISNSKVITDSINYIGKFGIGVETFDQHNLSYNRNGIYRIELLKNNEIIYNIKFDRFSFNDKKYINYFIDYKELKENNSKVVKLFSSENSNLSFLKKEQNGNITFKENVDYNLELNIYDFEGNKKNIIIPYKKNSNYLKQIKFYEKSNINIDEKKTYDFENKKVIFFKNSYLENQFVSIKNLNDTLVLVNKNYPLNKKIKVSFKIKNELSTNKNIGIGLVLDKSNKIKFLPSIIENNELYSYSDKLGSFFIAIDSDKPTIKPLNFKNGDWVSKKRYLKLEINDLTSGIKKYDGSINGKWILLEYDPKKKLLTYDLEDLKYDTHKLNLILNVEDLANNKSIYKAQIYRDIGVLENDLSTSTK